jgi:hypothetical protein
MLDEIRPGLWRWTARHPEWRPGAKPESPADWPPAVGCVACAVPDRFVFIDPLVPGDRGEEEFWRIVGGLIRAQGAPVSVLTTIKWHRRSRDEFVERFGASASRARSQLPDGVETVPIRGAGETMVWLPEHRALIPGDRLLGDGRGGLRLCPESWLGYLSTGLTLAGLRDALQPLLDLPVETVLVSHGEPVLSGGRDAVARALAN